MSSTIKRNSKEKQAYDELNKSLLKTENGVTTSTNSTPPVSRRHSGTGMQEEIKKPPPMAITMLVVGTYGDVQPFLLIAQRLKADGHRVRLASHPEYRDLIVKKNNLEFYPLGGNPRKLSALLVKTGGWLVPNAFREEDMAWLNMSFDMIGDIMKSSWPACTEPDPEDPLQRPFTAQAILANPVAYGHIHCAEKLDIPLQFFFLQPWTPTNAFPHPFSNLPYSMKNASINRMSYYAVDGFFWRMGLRTQTNAFRESIGLKPMTDLFDFGIDSTKNVPIGYLWSEELVPTPNDWGANVDICGSVFAVDEPFTPSAELVAFLNGAVAGSKSEILESIGDNDDSSPSHITEKGKHSSQPVYIGFGSMVIDDEKVLRQMMKCICSAAVATKTRVLVQSSWARFDDNQSTDLVYVLNEKVPHHWLFQRCSAVIHHGGASTTSMGLKCGKPTMVCPFFGDQFFWAQEVVDAGVGVPPLNALSFTIEELCNRFQALKNKDIISRAKAVGKIIGKEDGATNAVYSFYRQWQIDNVWRLAAGEVALELAEQDRLNKIEEEKRAKEKQAAKEARAKRLEKYSIPSLGSLIPDMPDMPSMGDISESIDDIGRMSMSVPSSLFSSFSDEVPEPPEPLMPKNDMRSVSDSATIKDTKTKAPVLKTKTSPLKSSLKVSGNGKGVSSGKVSSSRSELGKVKPGDVRQAEEVGAENQEGEIPRAMPKSSSRSSLLGVEMENPLSWLASAQEERPTFSTSISWFGGE